MPITLQGQFNRHGVYREAGGRYSTDTSGKVGIDGEGNQYKLYLAPGAGDAYTDIDSTEYGSMRLSVTLSKKTAVYSEESLALRFYDSVVLSGAVTSEELFNRIDDYSSYITLYPENTTKTQTLVYENADNSKIRNILKYGVGLVGGFTDMLQISDVTLEVDAYSALTPPEITVDTAGMEYYGYFREDGTYVHQPNTNMIPMVIYRQETDSALASITIEFEGWDGVKTKFTNTGVTGIVIPNNLWGDIPNKGIITIHAISEAGVKSNTLLLPFEVAHRDVVFSSHVSGSIIQSDENVELSWGTTIPDEYDYAPDPSQYHIWAWWDDGKKSNGILVTESSYTITKDELAGRRVLHVEVDERYGADGGMAKRREGDGATLNLYIQNVAGIRAVEVGPMMYDSTLGTQLCKNPPYVKWDSTGQTAAQVRFGSYTSPVLWGGVESHVIPKFFPEFSTQYAQVRVQDENGTWSEWTEPVYAVMDRDWMAVGKLIVRRANEFVRVVAAVSGKQEKYCLMREDIMLAQFNGTGSDSELEYIDTSATGACVYELVEINYRGSISKSEPINVNATPKTDGIVAPSGEWIPLKWTTEFPRVYRTALSEETYAKYYAGQDYPVYMRTGRKSKQLAREYVDFDGTLADRLEALIGQTVWFKDTMGNRMYGELSSVSAGRGRKFTTVSFVINQAHTAEGVELIWEGYNGVYID